MKKTLSTGKPSYEELEQKISLLERSVEKNETAYREFVRQSALLDGINKIFHETLKCNTVEEVAWVCLRVAEDITQSKFGFISEITCKGTFHNLVISNPGWDACSLPVEEARDSIKAMQIRGIRGKVIHSKNAIIFNEPQNDPDWSGIPEGHPPITRFLGVPLLQQNLTVGIIGLGNKASPYTQTDLESIQRLSVVFLEALIRKRSEIALRESEAKFRHIYDNSPVMMHSIDENGTIVNVNRQWLKELGYDRNEVVGKKADFLMTAESSRRAFTTVIPQFWKDGFGRDIPYRYIKKDGAVIDVLLNCDATIDPSGKAISLTVVRDITTQKHAQEQLGNTMKMLQTVFDGIYDPLILAEMDMTVRMLNKAALTQCVAANTKKPIGKPCYAGLKGRENPCPNCAIPALVAEGKYASFERKGIEREDRVEKVTIYPIKNSSTLKHGAVIHISDITGAKILQRQLIQNEKLASLGLLISGVAHEINNPTNYITFNVPIMRDYLKQILPIMDEYRGRNPDFKIFQMPYDEFREDIFNLIDNIEQGASRIARIISGLRDFIRMEDIEKRSWVDIKSIVEGGIALCENQIRKNIRDLQVHISEDIPLVYTNPMAVEQVLINLLINASHAADKENSWIKIIASSNGGGRDWITIKVIDNGIGMDESVKKRIFEPFFTDKKAGKGTGLGLYICRHLVESIGGKIEFDSRSKEGTEFRLLLPVAKRESEQ